MDVRRITEVGVAVRNLDQATALLVDLFGATAGPVIDVARYDMRFRMCRLGKIDFELMEPTGEQGVIWDFLQRRGEGLHHIAFAVDDLTDTMATLGAKNVAWVDPQPIANRMPVVDYAGRTFDNSRITFAFTQPKSILGILFEFIQYPEEYQTP